MTWKRYWIKLISIVTLLLLVLYIFILLVDPYDTLDLSLSKFREPIVHNQRYSYPAIAQKDFHDSTIIGTSTIRLLHPKDLKDRFDAKFVNLAMNSATAYEQSQILKLFRKTHKEIKYLILGIDIVWCDTKQEPSKLTFRHFPSWLYDDSDINDYFHILSYKALENAVRMIEYWSGKRDANYSIDGYGNFVGDDSNYNLKKAISNLYGGESQREDFISKLPQYREKEPIIDKKFSFPVQEKYLPDMIFSLPDETLKLIVFIPFHYKYYYDSKDKFEACKTSIREIIGQHSNTYVIDLMRDSEITSKDDNYWDPLHYRIHIAEKIPELILEKISF